MNGYTNTDTLFMAKFPLSKAGLSTVGYQLKNASGVNVGSRVTTGITEVGHGYYQTSLTFPSVTVGTILWDTGEVSPLYAAEEFTMINTSGSGAGSILTTITVKVNDVAVEGVAVYISSDITGGDVIAGTFYTDTFGKVSFMLDVGTYYVWKQLSHYNFTNPEIITVS